MQKNNISIIFRFLFPEILILILLLQPGIFAQEGDNTGNWFVRDRAYPFDTIPVTSFVNALDYQEDLSEQLGYTLPSPLQWTSIGPRPYIYSGTKAGRVTCVQYYPKVYGYTEHPEWIYITGHGGGVWKSTNNGINFEPITDALQNLTSGAIAFDPNNPNIMYYGTGGNVYGYAFNYDGIGVYKSTDAGQNWNGPYRTGFLKNHIQTFKIAVNPANSNHVYLACGTDPFYYPPNYDGGGGLYKSTDGGITWAIAPGTPLHKACNDVVIYYDPATQSNVIYAAGMLNFGYYISIDGGASSVILGNNNTIYVGGESDGIGTGKDLAVVKYNQLIGIVNNTNEIPLNYQLYQNYPNPFNPITKINYALPNKSNVTIKVFDILGRLVKTLGNETKDAGYYTITFDGRVLASGVYFYNIEAGDFNASKKMVLVK